MNILSLFDGMSCGQIALNKVGIEYENYYASEIDKEAIKVTTKNYPNTIQLGSITELKGTELPKIDLLIGGSPCFAKGSLVMTNKGYVPIEFVKVGDKVLTHKGRFKKVLKTGSDFKQIWNVKGMGNPGIQTTEEHPFYVRERYYKFNNSLRKDERLFHSPKWEKVKNLNKNFFSSITHTKKNKKSKYSSDFWYFVGRYTGDGWSTKVRRKNRKESWLYRVIICCGKHEFKTLVDIFEKSNYNYSFIEERTGYKFSIYRKELLDFLDPIGKGASNKEVHPLLFSETNENIISYLKGLYDSDGCFHKVAKEYRLTTTSRKLCFGVQYLITKALNLKTTIDYSKRKNKYIIEGRIVNQKDVYVISYKPEIRKQDGGFYEKGYAWLPIRKVEKTLKKEEVFNLEVEEDNSYTINNIVVHNCQGFSFAGKQLNFDDPRSKLFFEFVRLLKETEPTYFLLENVVMKKEHEDVISNFLGVNPILIDSSLVSAQRRKRLYWTNIPIVGLPEDKGFLLKDVIDYNDKNRIFLDKSRIKQSWTTENYFQYDLTGKGHKSQDQRAYFLNKKHGTLPSHGGSSKVKAVLEDGSIMHLSPLECERLQNVPENYTDCVSNSQRYQMLGNGWTIDVIAFIFSFLK